MSRPSGSVYTRQDEEQVADSSIQPLDCAAWGVIVFFTAILLLIIIKLGHPLLLLVATLTFVFPAFLAGVFIVRKIGDETLSKSFVFHQLFFGGFVAYIVVLIVEGLLIFGGMIALFGSDIARLDQYFPPDAAATMSPEQMQKALLAFFASIQLWKKLLAPILNAFLVAASIEELSKLVVGRRAKSRVGISPRTFLAGVMAGALGLSMTEHATYTLAMFSHSSITSACLISLIRAAVAFPLHLGTAMIYGIAMAEHYIKKEESNYGILKAFLLAIFFHGTWDGMLMLDGALIVFQGWAQWTMLVVLGVNLVLLGVLIWICRQRFNRMLSQDGYLSIAGDLV